jgi:hypothetical protein
MQSIVGVMTSVRSLAATPVRLATWNRRLLIVAAVLIAWGACVLALYAAGPEVRAMMAGEGTLITDSE